MLTRILRVLRCRDDDRGAALIAVIGIGAVLMVVLSLVVATATSGATKAVADDDYNKAMAAAYAGLSDYQGRLAADNSYVKYGVQTAFSGTSTYTAPDLAQNKAFTTSGAVWAGVVGSSDQWYRYEVDNSAYTTTGQVRLRVTGKAGDVTRSLLVDLRGDGFVNYLYFTNYESQDPSLTKAGCTSMHRNDPGWNASTSCEAVTFASGDLLDGPVRTNDVITACGATFKSTVQDTGADGFYYTDKTTDISSSCRASTHFDGGDVSQVGTLPMPSTNANMKQEVRYDISDKVATAGCLYTGPTSITFLAGGKMKVVSPWTKYTQMEGNAAGELSKGRNNEALCGSVAALHGSGATIKTLPANLVYVQTVPSSSTDWNYTAPNQTPTGAENRTISSSDPVFCQQKVRSGWRTDQVYGNGLGYPKSNEFTGAYGESGYYGCRNGDVFLSGSFGGQMTVAAENFAYITGSITYQNGRDSDDMLGIVGQKAVSVSNPISCSSTTSSGDCATNQGRSANLAPKANIEIDAAIASNLGTFNVQNSAYGSDLGTLTVYGSIAQQFRGSVRTQYGSGGGAYVTAYAKAYSYDKRLRTAAPPKFLQPVSTTYGVTTETETATAYRPDGSRTGR